MANNNAVIYTKTNIGGLFFDCYVSFSHNSELEITSHQVETGANISDHSYVKPKTLVVEVMMSDVLTATSSNSFNNAESRSVGAYEALVALQNARTPVTVLTRLAQYDNMLIKSIEAHDDADTVHALSATVTLVEIPVARLKTVKISAYPQATSSTPTGILQPTPAGKKTTQAVTNQVRRGVSDAARRAVSMFVN
nr:MAG TPA: hypothetical protein [Caudoviricetes sp.]